jgi:hypothetical protein
VTPEDAIEKANGAIGGPDVPPQADFIGDRDK